MSLMQMSFSGAVMIFAIVVVRALAINKLPKKVFVLLWEIGLLRLLIPFSIPSMLSAYSLVRRSVPIQEAIAEMPPEAIVPQVVQGTLNMNVTAAEAAQNDVSGVSVWPLLWIAGVILCATFFAVSYLRCYLEFRTSLPVRNAFAEWWLKEHRLRRVICIRQSDRISAPLTYGILRPVILMPKNTDWENRQQLQYVLLHEYVHICRFDVAWKLIMMLALCIHWFNPVVWVMYILYNRDTELSCDEKVVRLSGETSKSTYAMMLITMEEKKSGLTPLCNNFSKNAIEERITAIMKIRRITKWALAISAAVLVAVVVLFATSAEKEVSAHADNVGIVAEEIEVPDVVLESAKMLVGQRFANVQDSGYSNWRIEALAHVYTYDDLAGMTLQVYQMNYEFLADDPDEVTLAGGMTIDEEGWVVPEYANSTYLVFEQREGGLVYLTSLVENDSFPGDDIFTNDLIQQIGGVGNANEETTPNVRESKAMIPYELAGDVGEMPATLYVGDGFSIYIPDDGWQIYDEALEAPYQMEAVYESALHVDVARYVDQTSADVVTLLQSEGYTYNEITGKMQKFEGDLENQMLLEARVYGYGNDVWVIYSRYFAAVEWGSRLDAIADTFAVTVNDAENPSVTGTEATGPKSEGARKLERIMTLFYTAYFDGDVDTIKQYLVKDYQWNPDVYEDPQHASEVEIKGIKGLNGIDELNIEDQYEVSLEFRAPNEDSFTYLSTVFVYDIDGSWKISFYGLEK